MPIPANFPDLLAERGLDVNVFGDWWGLGGSANHGAVVLHHTASSPSSAPQDDAAYCHHGSGDAPLYNALVDRTGAVWLLASDKSNSSGKISSVPLNEALSGRAGSVSAVERGLGDDTSANDRLWAVAAQNSGVGEPWGQSMCDAIAICAAVALETLGLPHAGYCTQHRVLTARKIDNCGDACPYDFQALVAQQLGGGRAPERTEDDDMRALTDDDGGVYVFGPGIFEHQATPEHFGSWERFTGPAERVNNAQRDIIRTTCLSAGNAPWTTTLQSRIDANRYAAGDILTSAEANAYASAAHESAVRMSTATSEKPKRRFRK